MRLLVTTQIVDEDDQMLGFFHQWLEEFAKHCESVHVICLKEGKHSLPDNVHVYSLGKEGRVSRWKYLRRFFTYIWQLRKDYDAVFAHQNQIYILLGWPLWRLFKKPIGLWYMHRSVTTSLRVAEKLTNHIFTASKESFRIPSQKLHITGHGIDDELFTSRESEKLIDLFTVGRMVPAKNLEQLVEVLEILRQRGHELTLTIAGSAVTPEDKLYEKQFKAYIAAKNLTDQVIFLGAVKHAELPELYTQAKVFVHAAKNGSLDKTLLEPLLMNVPLITSAEGAASLPLGSWHVSSTIDFADQVEKVLQSDVTHKIKLLNSYVTENHTLRALIPKIINEYGKGIQ